MTKKTWIAQTADLQPVEPKTYPFFVSAILACHVCSKRLHRRDLDTEINLLRIVDRKYVDQYAFLHNW